MLARIFVIIGGLIVLALTAALVGPYFVDWTSYRADFEREASAVLGRKVTVEGDATATLLPFPSVTFSDVTVAGNAGRPALTVETFSMDAELAPFMSGEFLIFDMRMVRPRGSIDIGADGTIDWAVRPSTPFDAARTSLEKLTITEGQIEIRHAASGRAHRITELNADISAKTFAGPWRMTGSARLDGLRTALSVSTGSVDETGSTRLRIRAEPAIYAAALEADGNIRLEKGAVLYAGQFRVLPKTPPAGTKQAADAVPPYRLGGTFSLDDKRLSVDTFRFETGPLDNPYSADGTGFLDLGSQPRFQLTAEGAQVRFDEAVGAEGGPALSARQRIVALEEALIDLPKPAIPGEIDVNLPAVVAGGTTVRDVRLKAEPSPDGWTIKSFGATLPGRTTLEADGALTTADALSFKGSLLVAVGQPSGFAAWVARDVDEAIRRLPAAGFSARVDLAKDRQSFEELELQLGAAGFRGKAVSLTPDTARPSTTVSLTGGALDVDGLAAFASLFLDDSGASRFSGQDFDVAVKAGPVEVAGLKAAEVDVAARLREGRLDIDRFSVEDVAGATLSATGRITDLGASPSGSIDASVVAVDLAPVVAAAAARFPANAVLKGLDQRARTYGGLLADSRIDVVASVALNGDRTTGLALSGQGTVGGTSFSTSFSAKGAMAAPQDAVLSLTFDGRNADSTALLALYGLPVLPLDLLGAGETGLAAKGTLGALQTDLSLKALDFETVLSGTLDLAGDLSAKGRLSVTAADIEPWMTTVGASLPGMGFGRHFEADADADLTGALLVLSNLKGVVGEDAVEGDINAQIDAGKPHLTGELTLDLLDLEPALAMVLGNAALFDEDGGWSSAAFGQNVLTPFTADLRLNASTLAMGTTLEAYDAGMALTLNGDGLRIADLKARMLDGELEGLVELKNTAGTALLSGQMKLGDAELSSLPGAAGVTGRGTLTTTLSASGKSVEAVVAALSGSGTMTASQLVLPGIDPDAFPELIEGADRIGRDIDGPRTAAFAPAIVVGGDFASAPVEAAFTLASGVARFAPTTFETPNATLQSDLLVDLNSRTLASNGTLAFRPGDEALVGSEPVVNIGLSGRIDAPVGAIDTTPLAQFLSQRALEIEQARVEAMQAVLLEKQRLRREVRYFAALQAERDRTAEILRRAEEAERIKAEEARAEAEKAARAAALAAEQQRQAQEAGRRAEEEAARRAADEAGQRAAEEASRRAAERAQREADAIQRAPLPAPGQLAPFTLDPIVPPAPSGLF